MNTNLLMQLIQSMNENQSELPQFQQPHTDTPALDSPFDMLFMLRPMLPHREQLMIDVLVKVQELKILIDEMQNSI